MQKLRIKFVTKRNQRKRLWEEKEEKDKDRKSSTKRQKTSEQPVKTKSADSALLGTDQSEDQKTKKREDTSVDKVNETKLEDETDEEDDPEEDPEECEEMEDEMEDAGDDLPEEAITP